MRPAVIGTPNGSVRFRGIPRSICVCWCCCAYHISITLILLFVLQLLLPPLAIAHDAPTLAFTPVLIAVVRVHCHAGLLC